MSIQSADGPIPPPRLEKLSETGRRVFHCLSLGLVVFDDRLQIVHANPAAEFMVRGHTSIAEALNAGSLEAHYQDWREVLREVISTGHEQRFSHVIYRDCENRELLLNLLCIPLADAGGGQITGGTMVIEDVTAAASMEKRLAVSERLAAVGKLAARVAHELNNPLDGILRYINLAIRAAEMNAPDKVPGYLVQARGGLLRMTEIIRQLVEFSRSTYNSFGDTGVNAILEEAVKVLSDQAIGNRVSVVCKLSEDVPAVGGTNLFQVFCNLIKNAIDAMPGGGTLAITSDTAAGEAVIRFEDTGVGLPPEAERIFEPFFTTKDSGKGTGLGLAICRDIIEKHNGKVEAANRPGGGSTFTVRLPINARATGAGLARHPA